MRLNVTAFAPLFVLIACAPTALAADEIPRGDNGEVVPRLMRTAALSPWLVESLLQSPEATERAAAVHVLGSLSVRSAVPQIERLLASDDSSLVRAESARAIGALNNGGIDALIRGTNDSVADVRVASIVALGSFEGSEASQAIERIIAAPAGDRELEAALISAARLRIVTSIQAMILLARDTDRSSHLRGAAICGLGMMGGARARAVILDSLRDPEDVVRFNAVGALEAMSAPDTIPNLAEVLRDVNEATYVRIRAASALARFAIVDARRELEIVAGGDDEFMAMHAIVALSNIDTSDARILADRLKSKTADPFVSTVMQRVITGAAVGWGQR